MCLISSKHSNDKNIHRIYNYTKIHKELTP